MEDGVIKVFGIITVGFRAEGRKGTVDG